MRRPWPNSRVLAVARRITAHHQKAEAMIRAIRESRHPLASTIADELENQCLVVADASQVTEDIINDDAFDRDEEEDDGCPKGDPECLSRSDECHDACEAPD